MANAKEIQLLPETRRRIDLRVPGQNHPLIFGLVFILLIGSVYAGIFYYKKSTLIELDKLNARVATVEQARDKKGEDKLLAFNQQLGIISPLLDAHVLWSEVFTRIQNLINPQVRFKSLTADLAGNKYSFTATAGSYTIIAKQIAAFYKDEMIQDFLIGRISSNPTGEFEFSVDLTLNSSKFLKKPAPKTELFPNE